MGELEAVLSEKGALLAAKEAMVASLGRDVAHAMQEIDILVRNRREWKNELLEVGREFAKSFEELKRHHEKEAALLKTKIA